MSTTTELLAANERYDRLVARIEALAGVWYVDGDPCGPVYAANLRDLLETS